MPCYDSRNDPSNVWADAKADARHNSDVAEILCTLCKAIERDDLYRNLMTPPLRQWWVEHQERDRKKAEQERRDSKNRIISARRNLEGARRALDKALLKGK